MSNTSTALSVLPGNSGIDINRVRGQRDAVQTLLKEVLKEGIENDYAIIPGTKKQTLLKPGAEKICSMFGIAPELSVEASRDGEDYTYRVTVRLVAGSVFLGEGVGEASTLESKFAWRKALCPEEYEHFRDQGKARLHWERGYNGAPPQVVQQVRENPADKAGNMLKMAKKRALIDAVLTATAASDIFTQDLEGMVERNGGKSSRPVSGGQAEAARTASAGEPTVTEDEAKKFFGRWKNVGKHSKETVLEYLKRHCGGITDDRKMPRRCYEAAMQWAGMEGAPVPEVKKAEPAPAAKPTVIDAKPEPAQEPLDPVYADIKASFDLLGTDLAEQAALFGEYRGKLADLAVELKSRVEEELSKE